MPTQPTRGPYNPRARGTPHNPRYLSRGKYFYNKNQGNRGIRRGKVRIMNSEQTGQNQIPVEQVNENQFFRP